VAASADIIGHLSPEMLFDALAVQVDGPAAWGLDIVLRWRFPDHGKTLRTTLRHGALTYGADRPGDVAATVTVPRAALGALGIGDLDGAQTAGLIVEGDPGALARIFGVLQAPNPGFNIIEP
jgi:alkyl sulfatase BDS1-like metallo-beta-lactamase superfamily hydrolase